MGRSTVGVDIGTRTVTMAEVTTLRNGAPAITNFGGIELPAGAVRDGEILDVPIVAEVTRELLSAARVRTKKVVLGVANRRVAVRQIDLPWMAPDELRVGLRFQAEEHLPIPIEDAEVDVHVVQQFVTEDGAHMQNVLLVGAHRDMIATHTATARKAGLKPVGVDLNAFAALRAIGDTSLRDEGLEVVIDIGASVTNVVVHDAGAPIFVRILGFGAQDHGTDDGSGSVGSVPARAVDAGAGRRGVAVAPGRTGAYAHVVDPLVDELRSSIDYYRGLPSSTRLSVITLTGGGAMVPHLAERLEGAVRLPVRIGDVLGHWDLRRTRYDRTQLHEVGSSLTVAVGLALGGAK